MDAFYLLLFREPDPPKVGTQMGELEYVRHCAARANRERLLELVADAGGHIIPIRQLGQLLEDVFIDLVFKSVEEMQRAGLVPRPRQSRKPAKEGGADA